MQDPAQASSEAPKPMSFVDKVVNIFASPGELYENVRLTPKTITNWLVPWLIFTVIAVALTQLVMSDPAIVDQMRSMMRQRIDQAVAEGKITQEMADQQIEAFGPGSTLFTITTIGGTVLWTFAAMFVLGLVYWVIGKSVMKAPAPYGKVVEVVGLTYFISTLDQIVTTIIIFVRGSLFSSLSLGLFVSEFDINNKVHILLSKLNVFSIWIAIVTAIGLAKLFQRDFPKVLVIVLVLWVFWVAFSVLTGFGAS